MKRRYAPIIILLFLFLVLPGCQSGETAADVLEEIRTAPAVKLECAGQEDDEPIFSDNAGSTSSLADMRIVPSDEAFDQEWLYRFTYNPQEKVIDGQEIVVLFGPDSLEIDGVTYLPEDGVDYDTILEWAKGVHDSYGQQ